MALYYNLTATYQPTQNNVLFDFQLYENKNEKNILASD